MVMMGLRAAQRRPKMRMKLRMTALAAQRRRKPRSLWFRLPDYIAFAPYVRADDVDIVSVDGKCDDSQEKAYENSETIV
eukprot:334998-Chlamydomonas_euryale.AAC.9